MTEYLQVATTVSDQDEAKRIARMLVERRLAACVQTLGPIESTYHWQGKIETSVEWLCLAKTIEEKYTNLEKAIRELHNYDVPEILATPIVAGSPSYLDWLRDELTGETSSEDHA